MTQRQEFFYLTIQVSMVLCSCVTFIGNSLAFVIEAIAFLSIYIYLMLHTLIYIHTTETRNILAMGMTFGYASINNQVVCSRSLYSLMILFINYILYNFICITHFIQEM